MKRALCIVLSFVLLLAVAACSDGTTAENDPTPAGENAADSGTADGAAPGGPIKIGMVVADFKTPFQARIKVAAEQKAAELGIEIDVRDGANDPSTQTTIIETFLSQNVDAIILVPAQVDALVPAVLQCNEKGTPVITVNRQVGEGAQVLTYVGCDDYEGGQIQGEMLVELLGDTGKVILEQGTLGSSAQVLREQGMEDYLAEHAPGIEIIAKQNNNWDASLAVSVTQNFLTAYPKGTVDAIVTQGPDCAVAAAETCANEGREELLGKIIGFDLPQNVVDAIKDGLLYGVVVQDPMEQGSLAVEVACDYITGAKTADDIPAETITDLPIADQSNIATMTAAW